PPAEGVRPSRPLVSVAGAPCVCCRPNALPAPRPPPPPAPRPPPAAPVLPPPPPRPPPPPPLPPRPPPNEPPKFTFALAEGPLAGRGIIGTGGSAKPAPGSD